MSEREWSEVREELLADPAFRAEWERTAAAHAVAMWLVRYRAQHGLSQRDLAARAGISQPAIARLEAGDVEPRLSTLRRLATALDVPLDIRLEPHANGSEGAVTVTSPEVQSASATSRE